MMELNAGLLVLISIFGGLGASVRYLVDSWATRLLARTATAKTFPWGLWLVNISGSFGGGVVTGLAIGENLAPLWASVVLTGFLGGYTTFSSASYDTVRLLREGRILAGVLNGFAMLFFAVVAVLLGVCVAMGF